MVYKNTCINFGKDGSRLGNQLFQLALLYSIRCKLGFDFYLPNLPCQLWNCFDINLDTDGNTLFLYREKTNPIVYDSNVFSCENGTAYEGYYQSYKYIQPYRTQLLEFLRFKDNHRSAPESFLKTIQSFNRPIYSMHVRRGDYVYAHSEDHWGNLHRDGYYSKVLDSIQENVILLVMSDDIAWCKENIRSKFETYYIEFNEYETLYLMSKCDGNIIANSTFSWWGAFLNKNSIVYAPSTWYGIGHQSILQENYRNNDIVPPQWEKIKTFGDI